MADLDTYPQLLHQMAEHLLPLWIELRHPPQLQHRPVKLLAKPHARGKNINLADLCHYSFMQDLVATYGG